MYLCLCCVYLSLSCLHVGPSLAPQSRLWGTVTSGIEWDGMRWMALGSSRRLSVSSNVAAADQRAVFINDAKRKFFCFSSSPPLVCSFQCQYSLIGASEW